MIDIWPIIDETIHPCRGCGDFDPPTGTCTSNGACADTKNNKGD